MRCAQTRVNGITVSILGLTDVEALQRLRLAVGEAIMHHARPSLPATYGRPSLRTDTVATSMRRASVGPVAPC